MNTQKQQDGAALAPVVGSAPWIAVEDRKPKTGQKVIVCGTWSNGNRWISVARWQPAGSLDTSMWDEVPDDWQDEDGNATNPTDEWMEEAIESETSWALPRVSHWMPLPALPNTRYGPPSDLEESQCGTIHAFQSEVPSGSCEGAKLIVTAWQPNEAERSAIAAGAFVYFSCLGGLPPHFITTNFSEASNPA